MTDYKTIRGKKVKFFETDLGNEQAEGQLFFQNTAREMKIAVSSAAWSSGAPVITGRLNCASGSTPRDASIIFGGFATPSSQSLTEEYNGSGWTENGNLNTARQQFPGFGTQTAAVGAGGYVNGSGDVANVEEYNGSSWSEVTDIPGARRGQAGFGTLTAGVICGGAPNSNQTFEYDGTNWTAGGNLPVGQDRTDVAGTGTLTAGLVAAGDTTESSTYNGTAWTDVGNTNVPHDGGADTGLQTAAVIISGFPAPQSPPVSTACETFDGTTFATTATVAQGVYGMGNGGASGTAALKCAGSRNPGVESSTEEFNVTVSAVTAAAWASGGNLPAVNNGLAGCGTQTAALGFGSRTPGQDQATYEYDGSAWTSGGSLGTPIGNGNGAGTQTAGLSFGGGPSGGNSTDSREYNGSSWTAGNSMNNAKALAAGTGTQTAALVSHGSPHPNTVSEEYNGTSWTAGGTVGTARYNVGAGGTSGGAVAFGGYPPSTYNAASEDYDGSSWTAGNSLLNKRGLYNGGDGANTNYVYATGGDASGAPLGSDTNAVEIYNGTNWSTAPNLSNGRRSGASGAAGSSSLSIFFGGRTGGSDQNKTEEFTGETTSLNLKTITDS